MNRNMPQSGGMGDMWATQKSKQSRSRSRRGSRKDGKLEPPKAHAVVKNKVPSAVRNNFLAMTGEFVGTFMFLFMAFAGTQVANTPSLSGGNVTAASNGPDTAKLLYISLCFGFSLTVNAWIFFRITGGLFNPAVTIGLYLIGAVPFFRGVLIFIAQILGGMAAAAVVSALFPGELVITTRLAGGTSKAQGLFIEMFLTAQLVFTIFMLAAEKHKSTFLAPVGIGLSLFIAQLAGIYYTGASLNPARSFGPDVTLHSFPNYHWIYWIGPILGALLASGFYYLIKIFDYETVNPGQDFDDLEKNAFDPETDSGRPMVQRGSQPGGYTSQSSGNPDGRMDSLMDGKLPDPGFTEPGFREDRESRGTSNTYTIHSQQNAASSQDRQHRMASRERHDRNDHDQERYNNEGHRF